MAANEEKCTQLIEILTNALNNKLQGNQEDTNHQENFNLIVKKAIEFMKENSSSPQKTAEHFFSVINQCMERNGDRDLVRGLRHMKEAFEPTFATNFNTEVQERNAKTIGWIHAPLAE